MDRNANVKKAITPNDEVALRKESVDRNIVIPLQLLSTQPSLSARKAWIEIYASRDFIRNRLESLSARRAWIEIFF